MGPGVGSYQIGSRPLSAGPNYSIGGGKKATSNKQLFNPGPGQYDSNTFMEQNKGVTIGQKFGKDFQTVSNLPGPGQYEGFSKRPMSGTKIGRAERNLVRNTFGPGPG